jgi:hypothetical protein
MGCLEGNGQWDIVQATRSLGCGQLPRADLPHKWIPCDRHRGLFTCVSTYFLTQGHQLWDPLTSTGAAKVPCYGIAGIALMAWEKAVRALREGLSTDSCLRCRPVARW